MSFKSTYADFYRRIPDILNITLRDGIHAERHGSLALAMVLVLALGAVLAAALYTALRRDGRPPRWIHVAGPFAAFASFATWDQGRQGGAALVLALALLALAPRRPPAALALGTGGLALLIVQLAGAAAPVVSGSYLTPFLAMPVALLPAWCAYLGALPPKLGARPAQAVPELAIATGWLWLASVIAVPAAAGGWFAAPPLERAVSAALIAACAVVPMAAAACGASLAPHRP